jgi:hypothetical protein
VLDLVGGEDNRCDYEEEKEEREELKLPKE